MHSATSIPASYPLKLVLDDGRRITTIKKMLGNMSARADRAHLDTHIHFKLTAAELALEENFYVFDYGNAM